MGDIRGFIKHGRELPVRRAVPVRIKDWNEVYRDFDAESVRTQASRCMDCGIPFCNNGCPLGNLIPDWNDLVYRDNWREAIERLHATNNFPEFTGRLCPAPCEAACVLGINEDPVTIKQVEVEIVDRAWEEGWITPVVCDDRTGRSVAVVGSGPAGLAAAQQLTRAGHDVVVFERADRIGGLLRYGIPEFKMEKRHLDRRLAQMGAEGTEFKSGVNVGVDISAAELTEQYDAVVLAGGATQWRDLPIPGRELEGIYQAMEYLPPSNRVQEGDLEEHPFSAAGKHVIIIGGGDTGADCIATAVRHGCASLVNFELLERPPDDRAPDNPWPEWPRIFRVEYAHAEASARFGADPRVFSVLSKRFVDDGAGGVAGIETIRVAWQRDGAGRFTMEEVPGTEETFEAELVLLAMGFLGPEATLGEQLGLATDERSNFAADPGQYATSVEGVFAAGDCRRGQSLIVWAINEGRGAAARIDKYLTGATELPLPSDSTS